MIRRRHASAGQAGFTLAEVHIATMILALAMVTALGSFTYVNRNERVQSVQGSLDLDVRMVIERLRRDLWLSASDEIVLFPSGTGPYTAISFPVIQDLSPDASVPLDSQGRILWDTTLVYHLWEGPPAQLRITTLTPRRALTLDERIAQLAEVVKAGGHPEASTRVLISNLVEWELKTTGAQFDGYTPQPGRRSAVGLGSAILDGGPQVYTFRLVDRHPASSGYHLGMDTLTVSPTGAPREAEAQYPVFEESGGTAYIEHIPGGVWSGNYRLVFPAAGTGAHVALQMNHDQWEERNFLATGVRLDRTRVTFDEDLSPGTNVVKLDGKGRVWEASAQTRAPDEETEAMANLAGAAVRVVLRGSQMLDGGWLEFDGHNAWIGFRSGTESLPLRLTGALIAECADPEDPALLMDFKPGTEQTITFEGATTAVVSGTRESDRIDLLIERDKSYVISFLVDHEGATDAYGYAGVWTPPDGVITFPSSYVIPAERAPTVADFEAATWSVRSDVVASPAVFAVEYVFAGYPPEGTFTSQIFDTLLPWPASFESLDWTAHVPEGAGMDVRIRSGSEPDLSDAPDWDAVLATARGQRPWISGRYVQVQATLFSGEESLATPRLADFTLAWDGEKRIVDVSGSFSTGPDHGVFEVLVNGTPLIHGVTVDLTVYRDQQLGAIARRRLTASAFAEIVPRNTGR